MSAATHIGSELVVLALNSGSSSLKFGLYRVGPAKAELLLAGDGCWLGQLCIVAKILRVKFTAIPAYRFCFAG